MIRFAFVVYSTDNGDVLLDDGTWGDDRYEERFARSCLVAANRTAATYRRDGWPVAVCPWEIPDDESTPDGGESPVPVLRPRD